MDKFELDIDGIKKYQQNRSPYLLIDYASQVATTIDANDFNVWIPF